MMIQSQPHPLPVSSQPHSLPVSRTASVKHHNRALTLVFGSNGQVSLLGFDGSIASVIPTAIPVVIASSTGGPTLLPTSSQSVSPIPYRAATSAGVSSTSSTTSAPASSSTAPAFSNSTDTDTSLPSIPTVKYPTPSPTAESSPTDHGVGAPFYLAIVLASLAFVACVSAFIAWWIRSRGRRRRLELEDPWLNRDDLDIDSPIIIAHTDPTEDEEKGDNSGTLSSTSPYYLPESIVRRSSSNLLPFPQTTTPTDDRAQDRVCPSGLGANAGPYPSHLQNPHSLRSGSRLNAPSSQATNANSRPSAERLETGLSVQESTHTLGRLRVANRVPGDVTSGDEGMTNRLGLQDRSRPAPTPADVYGQRADLPRENALQNTVVNQSKRGSPEDDIPLEPPGPATISWGRNMSSVAALRRTRRPLGAEAPTSKNSAAPDVLPSIPSSNPPGWTDTLKSTFWHAVGSVAGNGPSNLDLQPENGGSGSRFTPAPQRVASRHSPTSPSRPERFGGGYSLAPVISDNGADATTIMKTGVIYESPSSFPSEYFSRSGSRAPSTAPSNNEAPIEIARPPPAKVSNLNRPLNDPGSALTLDSLPTETGSVYSTDSAAARANLRKYGYADSISSRSGLGPSPTAQLDRPYRTSTPLSLTPSRLMVELNLASDSGSAFSLLRSKDDRMGSEDGKIRSRSNPTSSGETMTSSLYGVSRITTHQPGRSTIRSGHAPAGSATSSMTNMSRHSTRHSGRSALSLPPSSMPPTLTRKKGVIPRRPRPLQRISSTASSVQSTESGQSIREVTVRKALLERRRRVGAAASHHDVGRGESLRS